MPWKRLAALRFGRANSLAFFALAYAGGAALQKGIGFLIFMWLAHALSVADYARFGMLFALQSGVAAFAAGGIGESVIGQMKRHDSPELQTRLFDMANGAFLILSGIVIFAIGGGAAVLQPPGNGGVALLFVLIGGAATAFLTLQALLVRLTEHHAASIVLGVFAPLSGLLSGCLGFLAAGTVGAFYIGMTAGLLLTLVILRQLRAGHFGLLFDWQASAGLRSGIGPYLLIALLMWLSGYGNTYFVKLFFQTRDVAMFTFVYTLSAIMQLVATSMNQVWSPRFFRLSQTHSTHDLEMRSRRFYLLQGAVLGVVGAAMLLIVPPVLDFLGGNLRAYRDLSLPLGFLLAGYAAMIPWWHVQNYYMVHGEGPALMRAVTVTGVVGLTVWIGLMAIFGVIAVYVGFFVQMLLRSLATVYLARRKWPIRLLWEGPAVAGLFFAAAALAGHYFLR